VSALTSCKQDPKGKAGPRTLELRFQTEKSYLDSCGHVGDAHTGVELVEELICVEIRPARGETTNQVPNPARKTDAPRTNRGPAPGPPITITARRKIRGPSAQRGVSTASIIFPFWKATRQTG